MRPIFLSKIKINNLRHLRDLEIDISDNQKKHLIITGKNGSGKSTILNEIRNHIMAKTLNWFPQSQTSMDALQQYINIRNAATSNMKNHYNTGYGGMVTENVFELGNMYIDGYQKQVQQSEQMIQFLENYNYYTDRRSETYFFNQEYISEEYNLGDFITSSYDAKRSTYVGMPSGVVPIMFKSNYSIGTNMSRNFLQYIVNLRAEQSFANDENDLNTRDRINNWFNNLQNQLRYIFDNENLTLTFDRRQFNFFISTDNINRFDFNSVSEGFSSVLSIVTDLLLKSANKDIYQYSGIVLIDEVETHLHIDLQKKILPFLISLFPNIQFIITTHSPFILNSLSNTVIYDAEKNTRFEDFSAFSSEGIIEGYFRQDKYSEAIKNKINRFEELYGIENITEEQKKELSFLKNYFEEIPKFYSKELALKIEQIKFAAIV